LKLTIRSLIGLADKMNNENAVENKPNLANLNNYIDSLEMSVYYMIDSLDEDSKKLLSYKIIKSFFYPSYDYFLEKGLTGKIDAYEFNKIHFFDNIDFNEVGLTRTPFIFNAIEEYLAFYVEPQSVENYRKASDKIISKASFNDEMYDYVVNTLAKTFEISNYWEVYLYIMETYLSEVCGNEDNYTDETKLYNVVKNSRPGSKALNIKGVNVKGDKISLYDIKAEKGIVLLFWSPKCGYCKQIIKYLSTVWSFYDEYGVKLVLFSIVDNENEWKSIATTFNNQSWINFTDLKKTDSEVFNKYHIRGTPEIYVITPDFKIFSRPANQNALDDDLIRLIK
jgi:thioredoxin-related protein